MNQIKNRFTNEVICEGDIPIKELAEKNKADFEKADLQWANLQWTDLRGADLQEANLQWANLRGANLKWANLQWANLEKADLQRANLEKADLRGANLRGANLEKADLRGADLRGANLRGANLEKADLRGADLRGANLEFYQFPSIRLLSSITMSLSDELTLEAMRRNAYGHPHPERFDEWAKGGDCPYRDEDEEEFWKVRPRKEIWVPGPPEMVDRDFIMRICKEMKWKIRGYLDKEVE